MAETEEYLMTLLDEAERNIISDPLGESAEKALFLFTYNSHILYPFSYV